MAPPLVTNYYVSVPESSEGSIKRLPPYHSPVKWIDLYSTYHCGELIPATDIDNLVGVTSFERNGNTIMILTYSSVVQVHKLTSKEEFKSKLLCEWKTCYRLTSPVVYDKSLDSYVGVFHDYCIRVWTKDSTLEDVPKYTFNLPIFKVLMRDDKRSLIIFRNGNCINLPIGLESCGTFKGRALLRESMAIIDVASYVHNRNEHVCYLVKNNKDTYCVVTCQLTNGTCNYSTANTVRLSSTEGITGKILVASEAESPQVYFMRSNRTISKYEVIKKSWRQYNFKQTDNHALVMRHDRRLDTTFSTAVDMAYMGKGHFFIYGRSYDESKKAQLMVVHLENEFCRSAELSNFNRKARLFSCGEFMVCVDSKFTIFGVHRLQNNRLLHNHLDKYQLAEMVVKYPGMLPVLGLPVQTVWNRTKSYR